MNNKVRVILLLAVMFNCCITAFSQDFDREAIALQMNSCVASLTNLNDSPSMTIYERERKQLTDYLSKEGMVNIPEITELREQILGTIYQLKITQEERAVLKKAASIEKNGQKWEAISKGLSQVMVMVPLGVSSGGTMSQAAGTASKGGGNPYLIAAQATFAVLLTVARSAVDYNIIKNRQMSEEEMAMWNIRKQDLQQYASLNTAAFKTINDIFKNHGLSDNMEVQPSQMSEFNKIISEPDAKKRAIKLEDCSYAYRYLNDYYYYLGMAYLDQQEFGAAERNFNHYIRNAQLSHLFKVDDKLGCIYLAKLSYQRGLSVYDVHSYITGALENLPHNGAALIQCAAAYYSLLGEERSAFELLRKGLYDDEITNKESILLTISEWLPAIKKSNYYGGIKDTIIESINDNEGMVGLNSYLSLLVKCGDEDAWEAVQRLMWITGIKETGENLDKGFSINVSKNLSLNTDNLTIVSATTKDDMVFFKECVPSFPEGFSEQELFKKNPILSEQPSLIPVFFQYDTNSRCYYVRRDLTKDYLNRVVRNPSQIENLKQLNTTLDLTEKKSPDRQDLKKLVEFCKKNQSRTPEHLILDCKPKKGNGQKNEYLYCDSYYNEPTTITSHEISLRSVSVSSTYTGYTKIDKYSTFQPMLFASHPNNLIIVDIDDKPEPISVSFMVKGTDAIVYSIMLDGTIYYRDTVQVSFDNEDVKDKVDEITINKAKKRRWLFRGKDDSIPTASVNSNDEARSKQEKVSKKSRKEKAVSIVLEKVKQKRVKDKSADEKTVVDSSKPEKDHNKRKLFSKNTDIDDSSDTSGRSSKISAVKSWFKRDKKEK